MDKEVIKIANCSGYYGDKLSAAKELVDGGPIDVLTGDYLAELTMTILYNQRMQRGEYQGYVGTFLKQFNLIKSPFSLFDFKFLPSLFSLLLIKLEATLKIFCVDL